MQEHTFSIPNISCHHCTNTIETELKQLDGVKQVRSDVASKQVTVGWEAPADKARILALLKEINYPAAE